MIRNFVNSKYLLFKGALVLLAALSVAGCTTTYLETSGKMTNQNTSKHVTGYQMGNSDTQAVRPIMPLPALRR